MRQLNISLCVLQQGDEYLLQLRGDNPVIGGAGLIGSYGGKIEPNEDPAAAVCRELAEETTLQVKPAQLKHLGEVKVVSDHKLEEVSIVAQVYFYKIPAKESVKSREGELVRLQVEDIKHHLGAMTTGTRASFEQLL